MDRVISDNAEVYNASDPCKTNKFAMIAMSKLTKAILGSGPFINDLTCVPSTPASLDVVLNPGDIYQEEDIDNTPYGALPADTHTIVKQGILLDPQNFACSPPGTVGFSINYLIQIQQQDVDGTLENRAFFGSPIFFQNVNTVRAGIVNATLKAGTPATTGTQTTPTPDPGFIGAWVITVANGQTQILAGDIAPYPNAPFILEKLADKISIATGDQRYALKASGVDTGDMIFSAATSKTGWVILDDGTIGNASSGASNRANADTQALFSFIWNGYADQYCPVSGGRGANALADFNANKTITLPKAPGRAFAAAGTPILSWVFTASTSTDLLTLPATIDGNLYTATPITVSNSGGALPAPLAPATTYYVIPVSSTTIALAASAANAHAGAAINLTTDGTGTNTLIVTLPTRVPGEYVGEPKHGQTLAELKTHAHQSITGQAFILNNGASGVASGGSYSWNDNNNFTANAGGDTPFNIMPPTVFHNAFMKL